MRTKAHTIHILILAGFAVTTVVVPVSAQTSSNAEPASLKSVIVTGSLLPSAETAQATPVDVISTEAIEKTGAQNIQQLVRTLPSAYGPGNFGDSRGNGGDGSAGIGIRGLTSGTLVLINGRRMAPNQLYGAGNVDVNMVPIAAIERIEILKDGASAIYGADAQAGVVNLILKKNYNGSDFFASYGNTTETDVGQQNYSFVTGTSSERASLLIGGSYYRENALFSKDRDRSKVDVADIYNTSGIGNPGRINDGTFGSPNDGNADPFLGYGTPLGLVYTGPRGTSSLNPADYRDFNAYTDRFPYPNFTPAILPVERYSIFGNGEYDFFNNKSFTFFAEPMYTHSWAENQLAPTPIPFQAYGITIPANNPYNPFGVDIPRLNYRLVEAGPRTDTYIGDLFRLVAGARGNIAETTWSWEAAFTYGLDQRKEIQGGDVNVTALANQVALTTPDAFNPFGNAANTPSQYNPVVQQNLIFSESDIKIIDAKVQGELFELKSGPVQLALGGAHQQERSSFTPDATIKNNQSVGFGGALPFKYDRDVNSVFGELAIPLLGGDVSAPGFHSLEVRAALRYDDYSDFGDTVNPKISIRWEPFDESLVLRGSWGTSFRAPDVFSLASEYQNYPEVRNPYSGAFEQPEAGVIYKPNPDLDPEEAVNWTAGFVWSPKFIKGFTASVDYYRIDIDNWIGSSTQFILNENYRTGGPTDPSSLFYDNVKDAFDPSSQKYDNASIIVPAFNLENILTEGIDFELNYTLPTDTMGDFNFRLAGTKVLTYEQQTDKSSGAVDRLGKFSSDEIGFQSIPEWRGNASVFWKLKGLELGVTANYTDSMQDDILATDDDSTPQIETRQIPSIVTFDLQASYSVGKHRCGWISDTKLTVGCLNVTDKAPPRVEGAFADKYDRDLHDLRQRFLYVSLSKKF